MPKIIKTPEFLKKDSIEVKFTLKSKLISPVAIAMKITTYHLRISVAYFICSFTRSKGTGRLLLKFTVFTLLAISLLIYNKRYLKVKSNYLT